MKQRRKEPKSKTLGCDYILRILLYKFLMEHCVYVCPTMTDMPSQVEEGSVTILFNDCLNINTIDMQAFNL